MRNLCILLLLLHASTSFAQKICDGKALRKAYLLARNDKYYRSINVLEQSLITKPNCSVTLAQLVELYYRVNKTGESTNTMARLYTINETEADATLSYLLSIMKEYKDDRAALQLLQTLINTKGYSEKVYAKLKQQHDILNFAVQMQTGASSGIPMVLNNNINIGSNQSYPSISSSNNTLYFTYMNKGNEDIYCAHYDTCLFWQKAKPLPNPPNTSFPEGSPRLSADGNYLLITRGDQRSELGWEGGGCDIFLFYKQDDTTWSSPQKFGGSFNTPSYEGQACMNATNNVIYFVSDRLGGYGGKDIYRSSLVAGRWQSPVNLGPSINTAGNEESPFIHTDNESFYFSSNGYKSIGGYDLYKSTVQFDSIFTKPMNLGYPTNTSADETGISVSLDGTTAWFSRNSDLDKANFTIWNVQLLNSIAAKPTIMLHGKMMDKFTGSFIKERRLDLLDSSGKLIKMVKTNGGDASYAIPILLGNKYKVNAPEIEDYKEFSIELDSMNLLKYKSEPLNIQRKTEGVVDTLYSATYTDMIGIDTILYHLLNTHKSVNTNPSDSITYFLDWESNVYVNDSLRDNVCFSDEGLKDYEEYISKIKSKHKQYCAQYSSAYKYNIERLISGNPKLNFATNYKEQVWLSKGWFKFKITVVEYY